MNQHLFWPIAWLLVFVLPGLEPGTVPKGSQRETVSVKAGVLEGIRFGSSPDGLAF